MSIRNKILTLHHILKYIPQRLIVIVNSKTEQNIALISRRPCVQSREKETIRRLENQETIKEKIYLTTLKMFMVKDIDKLKTQMTDL